MDPSVAKVVDRETPIIAVALHAGTCMREELLGRLQLPLFERTDGYHVGLDVRPRMLSQV